MRRYCGIASAGAAVALAVFGISTAAAAVTAAPPSLGAPSYNQGWAGYTAGGGRWFRYVSTTVTVPPRTIHGAGVGAAFIALQHARPTGLPEAMMFASPGGGAASVTYLATGGGVLAVSPHVGDRLALSIYYDQHGHDYFTATDLTRRTTRTVRVNVGTVVYDLARLGASPASSTAPPAADIQLWQFAGSHVTTYSGDHGTILGPWTTSKVSMTSTGTASGTIVASPSALRDNGRSFGVWLRARRLPVTYTSAFAGYVDSGGPLRFVSTTLTVPVRRVPGEALLVILGYNGGATPRPYTNIEVLAGGGAGSISYQASTASGSFTSGTFAVRPIPGDQLTVSIYYDQHGYDYFTVTDTTRHTTRTVKVTAVFYGTSGYNTAEILAMIKNSAVTPPPADIQLWKFTGSHITTYSGDHGTILGPWATSQYTDTTTGTAAGATVMSASVLSNSSQNFGVWLRHR
jgi:hypothetical protein